ncbi:MAG: acylphosphatase [Candidatus Diapherotrites archaeon]|nr:acylphosphatase [Candidatus Diapherotrites archaeon]
MEQLHAFVSGDVQGVGFRYFVASKARALGITGFVMNLPDGIVEVLAQGSSEALQQLLGTLRRGPAGGHVEKVEAQWQKPERIFKEFGIKHY